MMIKIACTCSFNTIHSFIHMLIRTQTNCYLLKRVIQNSRSVWTWGKQKQLRVSRQMFKQVIGLRSCVLRKVQRKVRGLCRLKGIECRQIVWKVYNIDNKLLD